MKTTRRPLLDPWRNPDTSLPSFYQGLDHWAGFIERAPARLPPSPPAPARKPTRTPVTPPFVPPLVSGLRIVGFASGNAVTGFSLIDSEFYSNNGLSSLFVVVVACIRPNGTSLVQGLGLTWTEEERFRFDTGSGIFGGDNAFVQVFSAHGVSDGASSIFYGTGLTVDAYMAEAFQADYASSIQQKVVGTSPTLAAPQSNSQLFFLSAYYSPDTHAIGTPAATDDTVGTQPDTGFLSDTQSVHDPTLHPDPALSLLMANYVPPSTEFASHDGASVATESAGVALEIV